MTANDFCTWGGSFLADVALCEMEPMVRKREIKLNIKKAIDIVAERLGNARTAFKNFRVHDDLISLSQRGLIASPSKAQPLKKNRGLEPSQHFVVIESPFCSFWIIQKKIEAFQVPDNPESV